MTNLLIDIPDNPIPSGAQAEEITAPDGATLRASFFRRTMRAVLSF